jgi:cation diffusion facilitator CzcD-associated flavoprotein CzcO
MSEKLGHEPRLVESIIPKSFNVGCRRPSPDPGYLEALVATNTTVYTDALHEITRKGFLDHDGHEVEVDVILCATGSDTSFRPRFPIVGLDGVDIRDLWKNWPLSYLSLGAPRVPNYFIYLGPYGPLAHGSALTISEALTQYLIHVVKKMRREHIRRLSPSVEATKAFGEHASLYAQRTRWSGPCRSWFKQGTSDGPVAMWPGSRLHFFDALKEPRYEDYEIEYIHGNRFGYFGNGFSAREFNGSDMTYYMGSDES